MPRAFIGTSGYNYLHWWNGVFYPSDLPQSKWLEFYAQFFDTVELNVSFYRLPKKETFAGWHKRTPDNFSFAVKGSRFITHIKRLKECREPLELFFDRVSALREKASIILWQLPPQFKFQKEDNRLKSFLKDLSDVFRPYLKSSISRLRQAFEFREASWFCDEVFDLLREENISLCIADWPEFEVKKPVTADFVYLRRHGATALYASCYSDQELEREARQIEEWLKAGRDVYIYFNNDAYGYAVKNGLRLKELLTNSLGSPNGQSGGRK